MSQSCHVTLIFQMLNKVLCVINSEKLLRIFYKQGIIPGSAWGKDERLTKQFIS